MANFLLIWAIASRDGYAVLGTAPGELRNTGLTLVVETLAGITIRAVVETLRGKGRGYLRAIGNPGWISDTVRMIIFGFVVIHTYGWIKLTVPIYHPRLFDQQLWELDRTLMLGLSPNIFFLNLFSQPAVLRVIDGAYARIFLLSLVIAFVFFLSHPSRRIRIAFITGNAVMWISGAWLYLLLPSLGPAFVFPDVWLAYARALPVTHHLQVALMENYRNVIRLRDGANVPVRIIFGVAAFPSMHVAFQTYVLLWMRRVWRWGQLVFGIFLLLIILGSLITGWHYLIDGLAGMVLAALCYAAAVRALGVREWHRRTQRIATPP
ncbi:MAG: hydrolase, PAP2-like superfamily [Acidobacteria bacterium]|nr:hydrolase, PAP2-like superfamily [Acidobacteriota bacterium]